MLKYELEERLGYSITEEGYNILNRMYNATNLDKDDFAKLVKDGAKTYKQEYKPMIITFSSGNMTPNGCYYIGVKEAELVDFDIRTGKIKVRNVRYYNGDGYSYYSPKFYEDRIVVVE